MSNMAKAIRRSGEIWLGMAKEVYVEPKRKMKLLGARNEIQTIELLRPIIDEESGQIVYENDLSNANLDVAVDVGPSFSSQRAAIVRTLTDMMAITTDQQTQQVLQAIALMNMEGEGMSDAREYFRRKLVDMGVLPPNEEDKKRIMEAMANRQLDPNTVFMQAAAEEATAKATRARAEVVKAMADTELTRAKTVETLANIDMSQRDQILRTADTLGTMLRKQATEVAPPRSQ